MALLWGRSSPQRNRQLLQLTNPRLLIATEVIGPHSCPSSLKGHASGSADLAVIVCATIVLDHRSDQQALSDDA